jgi:hypothetical protein
MTSSSQSPNSEESKEVMGKSWKSNLRYSPFFTRDRFWQDIWLLPEIDAQTQFSVSWAEMLDPKREGEANE